MTWNILIAPDAEDDIQEAYDWYERKRRGLGERFLRQLRESLKVLEAHPTILTEIISGVRFLLVAKFPYAIYYLTIDHDVHMAGVIHTSRDPAVWKLRVSELRKM